MPIFSCRAPVLLLSMLGTVFTLPACSVPHAMPTGYVYHDKKYKSPNPPESPKFTTAQRTEMGPEQSDQFRLAVYTLVDNLTNRAGMPPKAVYVVTPVPMTPFYANMDNDVRESLRHVGYKLANTPDDAYAITYKAEIIKKDKVVEGDVRPNVHLTLFVHDKVGEDSRVLTQESGDFFIKGADSLNVPFASFPGTFIPEPSGPGANFRE